MSAKHYLLRLQLEINCQAEVSCLAAVLLLFFVNGEVQFICPNLIEACLLVCSQQYVNENILLVSECISLIVQTSACSKQFL